MIYLTSDLHLSHDKTFIYEARGFNNIEEHNNTIIANWNNLITDEDEVYVLGDLMMNKNEYNIDYLNQLKGKIHVIPGNHDTKSRIECYQTFPNFEICGPAIQIKKGHWGFHLCHFPTMVNNFDEQRKFFCLHGHTHSTDKFQFLEHCCYNVAVDAHNMTPVSLEEIILDIKTKYIDTFGSATPQV